MSATRVFIHGLESTGNGTKGVFFHDRYPEMVIEDYFGPFPQRMEKLEGLLAGRSNLILVGSSYGGLMAATYACLHADRVSSLVLLAPALHLVEFEPCLHTKLLMPTTVFHGRQDAVVPLTMVRTIAERLFINLAFHELDDDHSLHETFPTYDWDRLLDV